MRPGVSRKLGCKMGRKVEEEEKSRPLFQLFIVRRTDNLNSPISLSLHILNAAICARKFAVLRRPDPTDAQMQKTCPPRRNLAPARLKYKFHMRFRLFRNEITSSRRASRNTLARFRNQRPLKHGSRELCISIPEN